MKRNRRLLYFFILVFIMLFNFIRPKLIIYGSPDNSSDISAVMDIFDKKYNGDVSLWYVDKIKKSTKRYILWNDGFVKINYPLIYDKKGSGNFIICYYMENNADNMKTLHRFFINAENFYFFRIGIYINNNGDVIDKYIQKYPWSRRLIYSFDED